MKLSIYARVHTLMKDGKLRSYAEMARVLECHSDSTSAAIRRLRDEGSAHIEKWDQRGTGTVFALWVYGPGKDAPRPPIISKAQSKALRIARACTEQHYKREAKAKLAAIRPFRDPMTEAFFGSYHPQQAAGMQQ